MARVTGNADGYVLIDSKMSTKGIDAGAANVKGQFAKMAQSASQASQQIEGALAASFSKSVAIAQLRVQSLENQFASLSAKFSEALAADDDTGASRLGAKLEKIYDKIEEARKKLRIEVEAEANKQAEAERKAAEKAEKAHIKANNKSEKETKRSSKTLGRFGTRLSGIAMSAFLFNSLSSGFRDIAEYIGGAITSTDEMKTALSNLKGAAQQAAAPIIQAITPALTALANAAATALSYVAQLFAAFSGKSVAQLGESAKAMNKNAKAAGKLSRSIAGFDQLTKLQDSSGGGGGGDIEPNYDYVAESVGFLDQMKEAILNGDWYGAGEILGQKITEMFEAIDWVGIGQKIGNVVGGIFSFALGLALNIDPFKLVGSINGLIGGLFQSIADAIQKLNWQDIGGKLVKAILFGTLMADPATALLTIIMSPNGDELVSGAFELVGSIIGALLSAIIGMGKEIGRLASELWTSIKDYFDKYIDWEGTPGEIIAGLFQGIVDALANVGQWIKNNIFQPFLDGFREAFDINSPSVVMQEEAGHIIDGLLNGIITALANIGQWIREHIFNPIIEGFRNAFGIDGSSSTVMQEEGGSVMEGLFEGLLGGEGRLAEICNHLWETITDAFAGLGEWFETTFGDAWQAVLDIFSGDSPTFEGIKEAFDTTFKDVFNNLAEGINKVIRTPFNKINSMLNKITGWEIGNQKPFAGLWGYNPVSIPQIPYLAKGAVIPPRAPFLAMLGDQRHGQNIEAPLSTIQEAVAAVMEDYSSANMAGHSATVGMLTQILEAVLGIEIGDDVLANAVNRYQTKMAIVRGG